VQTLYVRPQYPGATSDGSFTQPFRSLAAAWAALAADTLNIDIGVGVDDGAFAHLEPPLSLDRLVIRGAGANKTLLQHYTFGIGTNVFHINWYLQDLQCELPDPNFLTNDALFDDRGTIPTVFKAVRCLFTTALPTVNKLTYFVHSHHPTSIWAFINCTFVSIARRLTAGFIFPQADANQVNYANFQCANCLFIGLKYLLAQHPEAVAFEWESLWLQNCIIFDVGATVDPLIPQNQYREDQCIRTDTLPLSDTFIPEPNSLLQDSGTDPFALDDRGFALDPNLWPGYRSARPSIGVFEPVSINVRRPIATYNIHLLLAAVSDNLQPAMDELALRRADKFVDTASDEEIQTNFNARFSIWNVGSFDRYKRRDIARFMALAYSRYATVALVKELVARVTGVTPVVENYARVYAFPLRKARPLADGTFSEPPGRVMLGIPVQQGATWTMRVAGKHYVGDLLLTVDVNLDITAYVTATTTRYYVLLSWDGTATQVILTQDQAQRYTTGYVGELIINNGVPIGRNVGRLGVSARLFSEAVRNNGFRVYLPLDTTAPVLSSEIEALWEQLVRDVTPIFQRFIVKFQDYEAQFPLPGGGTGVNASTGGGTTGGTSGLQAPAFAIDRVDGTTPGAIYGPTDGGAITLEFSGLTLDPALGMSMPPMGVYYVVLGPVGRGIAWYDPTGTNPAARPDGFNPGGWVPMCYGGTVFFGDPANPASYVCRLTA
jgi:hypothetical protein